jgi:hypothetical protein
VALTVINHPIGHKLTGIEVDAQIINSAGDAVVYTGTAHGLSDGDYVYIQSNFDSYNGFKYVDSTAYDYFKIKESENGAYVQFIQNADIEYQVSILDHGYLAVHQPIVYEIESSLYPTNTEAEAYTPNTVDAFSDASGNTRLELDQALVDPVELTKIELVGTGPLAGVYQILTVYQDWSVVIDLAYDAANDFSGYTIVKYYDNYAINVRVYAGLSSDHPWTAQKPYELAATLKFVPDSNNRTKFSISEVLRSYINNRNNLTLDTLPNNLDFIVGFYIELFETYDQSDGTDITTFNSADEEVTTSIDLSGFSNGSSGTSWVIDADPTVTSAGSDSKILYLNYPFVPGQEYTITVDYDQSDTGTGIMEMRVYSAGFVAEHSIVEGFTGAETGTLSLTFTATSDDTILGFRVNQLIGTYDMEVSNLEITTIALVTDSFVGYALNSKLEFKNESVSHMSEYIPGALYLGQWLTLFDNPIMVVGQFFDLSFINTQNGSDVVITKNGVTYLTISNPGIGIIRVPIEAESGDTLLCIAAYVDGDQVIEEICITVIEECDSTFVVPDDVRLLEDGSYRLLE